MSARLSLATLAFLFSAILTFSAEQLHKRSDAEGYVHYGTARNPNLCCMCQPAVSYETRKGGTIFYLRQGLARTVGNERVFLSGDNEAWYCEGAGEAGKFGKKCGLVPPAM